MQIGMLGLGLMGANMVRRLMKDGHECVVFDQNADAVKQPAAEGAVGASDEADFISKLSLPRAVWMMVLTTALYSRFNSRGKAAFNDKLLSAMSFEFGGHYEKTEDKS